MRKSMMQKLWMQMSKLIDEAHALEKYRSADASAEDLAEGGEKMRDLQRHTEQFKNAVTAISDDKIRVPMTAAATHLKMVCSLSQKAFDMNLAPAQNALIKCVPQVWGGKK